MMSPWRKQGRPGYVMRVYAGEVHKVCGCGTTLKSVSDDIAEWINKLEQSANAQAAAVLRAIVEEEVTLAKAYELGTEGVLAFLAAQVEAAQDIDLLPHLMAWHGIKSKAGRGSGSADRYLTQIRTLYPESPLRRSLLTVPIAAARLDGLEVGSDATRNRYRAAFSSWCRWMVRRGVLVSNPAQQAGGYSEPLKPVRFRSMEQAEAVVQRLADPEDRAREALMAGAGLDWSDTSRLRPRDIDLTAEHPTVRCSGSKTPWRNRVVHITQPWVVRYIEKWLRGKLPNAMLFTWGHRAALRRHYEACDAAQVERFKIHEWRDTYAVAELQAGERPEVVAHQLGHKDPSLVWKRYGRYIPQAKDYRAARTARAATQTATPAIQRTAR